MIGKRVIVRAARAGVFYGTLVEKTDNEVLLEDCRRLYYWVGASECMQLAHDGVSNPGKCKFTVSVASVRVLEVIEIHPCEEKAIKSIEGVSAWKY